MDTCSEEGERGAFWRYCNTHACSYSVAFGRSPVMHLSGGAATRCLTHRCSSSIATHAGKRVGVGGVYACKADSEAQFLTLTHCSLVSAPPSYHGFFLRCFLGRGCHLAPSRPQRTPLKNFPAPRKQAKDQPVLGPSKLNWHQAGSPPYAATRTRRLHYS